MATIGLLIFLIFFPASPVLSALGFAFAVWAASQWQLDWENLLETAFVTAALVGAVIVFVTH